MKLTKILKEVMSEIGDASAKPYDIETVIDDESHRVYNFETDEPVTWYEIDMQEREPDDPFDNDGITLDIMFGTTDEEGNRDLKAITNKGQLYRVMATIVAAVKKDLENHRYIKTLSFEPSKRSGKDTDQSNARANLYKRFVKGQFSDADIEDGPDGKVIVRLPKKKVMSEIGDASKEPYGPIDTITDDEGDRQYGFKTESGTIYEVKVETFYRGEGKPVIAAVSFGIIGEDGDISYDAQTGENDIYRIMATIVAVVKKDLKSNHADIIEFSPSKRIGDKDQDPISNVRTKLYTRYIKGQFPNAEVTRTVAGDIRVNLKK